MLQVLVVREVLDEQLHQLRLVLDRLQSFLLAALARLNELLRKQNDRLLRRLHFHRDALACEEQILLQPFLLILLLDLGEVLHVHEVADFVVVEDFEDLYLHEFLLASGLRVRARVAHEENLRVLLIQNRIEVFNSVLMLLFQLGYGFLLLLAERYNF